MPYQSAMFCANAAVAQPCAAGYSGWFGVGSGLFGGLLMGSMLGGFGGWVVEDIGEGADREDGSATDW